MASKKNKKINFKVIVIVVVLFIILAIIISSKTYSRYKKQMTHNLQVNNIDVAEYEFNVGVNEAENYIQTINLKDTLDADSNYLSNIVVPGRSGHFVLYMNSTSSEVAIRYTITISRNNIPNNLKFYTDSNFTNELTQITGDILLDGQRVVPVTIYWKWLNIDSTQSNSNDSLYQNDQISFKVNVLSTQLLEGDNS